MKYYMKQFPTAFEDSTEEIPGSESSDNFSQEMRKQTKKKTTTPKKTNSTVNKKSLAVKSTKSGMKAPKDQNMDEVKTTPSKTSQETAKKPKTSRKSKKSLEKSEKTGRKGTVVNQGNTDSNFVVYGCVTVMYSNTTVTFISQSAFDMAPHSIVLGPDISMRIH